MRIGLDWCLALGSPCWGPLSTSGSSLVVPGMAQESVKPGDQPGRSPWGVDGLKVPVRSPGLRLLWRSTVQAA